MSPGKSLIILGLVLVAVGLMLHFSGRIPFLGRLPGDIRIEKEDFSFYFPLGSCLLLSLVLSLLFWLFKR
ncbi:DUF2905 domain-containing protein [Geoalkalibacter subterraneus]|uniref:Membrane protein n=1 Tax=Geoalkalibacter subterraneus TaxID=483547 RepID=A0A0B5FU92_9BACT|nr:DUF2905 domain-containing protein [Geoalkalibacter subterraneus]AJF07161.1 membrane protein [Geoalkalibacter subterraneus]